MKYLEVLNRLEKESTESFMWNRSGESIWISTLGYVHQEHMDAERELLKAGCQYDSSHDIEHYDKTNGRTTTWFRVPA